MAEGIDLGLSGLASGFDWRTLVDQLVDVERTPQKRLVSEAQAIQTRKTAYDSVNTQLSVLQNRIEELNDADLFDSRLASASDDEIASVSASAGAALGTYTFQISQLATAAVRLGSSNAGSPLSATTDVSGVTLSSGPFATTVTAGKITVNGKQVTIATTDTLQGVFDKISTATSGDVTGSYDPTTDRISLSSGSGAVVLGSATDTSNFLQVMRLSNNGTSTVTSSSSVGSVRLAQALASSNLATAIDDGGGAGLFKINGVEISFAASDSLSDILERINDSDAGVNAGYDSVNDRFLLTNKVTGDIGVALEDVTGNFLVATGLSSGTLQRGNDLHYTLNGGGQLSSHSNTITEETSGISGLSVEALTDDATVTVTVNSDTDKISKAISDFVEAYNKAQAVIDTNTASSTDANGKVTAGTLAGEREAFTIAADLRRLVTSTLASATGTIKRLEGLGISTNGDNDQISISDPEQLETALSTKLSEVKSLFMDEDAGLATTLAEYLEGAVGDDGLLPAKQNTLDEQVQDISDQIENMERIVQSNRAALIASFVSMEKAQQNINTQMQYLSRINAS